MQTKAILFGSIGTIVETSKLQHDAFNQAFAEAGLDWHWDKSSYLEMIKKSGGRQRIADYAEKKGVDVNAQALHERKTEIFNVIMRKDGLCTRSGVLELVRFAKDRDMRVGFATTTSRANVSAVFDALDGALLRSDFDWIGDVTDVARSKPDPEIYNVAMQSLGTTPAESLAIEDTAVSMKAAHAAGLTCIGFPGDYADSSAFKPEVEIVRDLRPQTIKTLQGD